MPIGTSRVGVLADATLVGHTRHQTAVRLLPFLFVLYIVNYLDRTSVAFAAIGMSRDLGISDRVFGLGVGVFFVGYLALQIPGSLLAEIWSARRTISGSMVVWGSLTALTALVHTPTQLYLARFLLGLAEASFFPGVMVYLSHWFIQKDRAKAASNFMAAIPLSLLIGSPTAGWIVGHHWLGVAGWRWLFVLEGIPAVVLGALGLIVFPPSLVMTLCLFSLMMVELASLPVFWAIPTEILSDTAAAGALGVASTIANIAGFFGPSAFGYLRTRTGSLASGYGAITVSWAASGVLMLMIPGLRQKARDAHFPSASATADY